MRRRCRRIHLSRPPGIGIEGVEDVVGGIILPRACVDALSTDGAAC